MPKTIYASKNSKVDIKELTQKLLLTGRAKIIGFGSFKIVHHKEMTNNFGYIPARKFVRFTPSKTLKQMTNER